MTAVDYFKLVAFIHLGARDADDPEAVRQLAVAVDEAEGAALRMRSSMAAAAWSCWASRARVLSSSVRAWYERTVSAISAR